MNNYNELKGATVFSAFCDVPDEAAEKRWSIYNSKEHNKVVVKNYNEHTGPEDEIDAMTVVSIIELKNSVRVYAR